MFELYIWKHGEYKLDTFSTYTLAVEAKEAILDINSEQKVWVAPVVCTDSVRNTTARYRTIMGSYLTRA